MTPVLLPMLLLQQLPAAILFGLPHLAGSRTVCCLSLLMLELKSLLRLGTDSPFFHRSRNLPLHALGVETVFLALFEF